MNIDIDASKNINYEKSYVAFIDVLGFKNLVYSQDQRDKTKLEQYFGIVNDAITYLKKIPAKSKIGSIIISDSIILSVPQDSVVEENVLRLRHLCVAVGLIQLHLSLKNIWVRGAISSGDAYFNSSSNQIIGPAYINSYLLEKELVNSPRVILDSKIINELKFRSATEFINRINMQERGGLDFSNWDSPILFNWKHPDGKSVSAIKNDVPLFIDYLAPIVKNNDENLIQLVENLADSIYGDTIVYDKFRWVAEYLKEIFYRAKKEGYRILPEPTNRLKNL